MRLPRRRTLWLSAALLLLLVVATGWGLAWFHLAHSRVTVENFDRLSMRMTKDEVYAILGEPTEIGPSHNKGLERAEWRTGPKAIEVEFRKGKVCTLGQAYLYKTNWDMLVWYVKKALGRN
jgi:hypothetical protein